jgi:hypothetical protein
MRAAHQEGPWDLCRAEDVADAGAHFLGVLRRVTPGLLLQPCNVHAAVCVISHASHSLELRGSKLPSKATNIRTLPRHHHHHVSSICMRQADPPTHLLLLLLAAASRPIVPLTAPASSC